MPIGWNPALAPQCPIGDEVDAIETMTVPRAKVQRRAVQNYWDQIATSVTCYFEQLDSADRQEPSPAMESGKTRLSETISELEEEMQRMKALEAQMKASPDHQVSLTDPVDAPDSHLWGDQRARLWRGRLQCRGGGGHQASSDRHQQGQRPIVARRDGEEGQGGFRR